MNKGSVCYPFNVHPIDIWLACYFFSKNGANNSLSRFPNS